MGPIVRHYGVARTLDAKDIATACGRSMPIGSDTWTTAAKPVDCLACKRSELFKKRAAAGGIAVDGDASPGDISRNTHFGARSRAGLHSNKKADYKEYLGSPIMYSNRKGMEDA